MLKLKVMKPFNVVPRYVGWPVKAEVEQVVGDVQGVVVVGGFAVLVAMLFAMLLAMLWLC